MSEATVTSLPPSAASGFLAPPPPPVGMRLNKPNEIGGTPNRLQQTSSIGMAHPTFRSDFNVNLRYFFIFRFIFCSFCWPIFIGSIPSFVFITPYLLFVGVFNIEFLCCILISVFYMLVGLYFTCKIINID